MLAIKILFKIYLFYLVRNFIYNLTLSLLLLEPIHTTNNKKVLITLYLIKIIKLKINKIHK